MFWLNRKKRQKEDAAKEAEIQAIRRDMNKKIDEATIKTEKVNKLLEEGGTAYLIFLATGGGRRNGKH